LAKGSNLYRIKVNRVAGGIKYSNTVALIYDSHELLITSVAPNPVHDIATLTLSTARPGGATFKVYDVSGNMVKQWQANIAEGNNTIEINVTGLPSGMYHVLVSTAEARTVTRFLKQ
ncbi:MAG: T9SS type A sorting domain-containing protein, partial [Bacteroidota bacterium]